MKAPFLGRPVPPATGAGAALLAATIALWPVRAEAAGHANNFGDKGQLMISADRLVPVLSFTSASTSETLNNQTVTDSRSGTGLSLLWGRNFGIGEDFSRFPLNVHTLPRVAADFTIIPHLTLGAAVAFGFGLGGTDEDEDVQGNIRSTRKSDAPRGTAIGIAPRVGYIIPLGDVIAFWPRVGFGFYSLSAKSDQTANNGTVSTTSLTDTLLSLDLDPQLAIIPVEHFFFHVGPLINVPLTGSRSAKRTTGATTVSVTNDTSLFHFGITAGIGGWFNL